MGRFRTILGNKGNWIRISDRGVNGHAGLFVLEVGPLAQLVRATVF